MLRTWRSVSVLLERGTRRLVGLAALSLAAGVLEAFVLVLVVGVAIGLAGEANGAEVELPLGIGAVASGPALVVAVVGSLAVIALHGLAAARAARMSAEMLRSVRSRLLHAYAGATWSRQSAEREGALQEGVSLLAQKSANLVNWTSTALIGATGVLALLIAAFLVDALAATVILAVGTSVALALRPLSSATRRRATAFVDDAADFAEEVSQWGSMAMELKVFGVLDAEVARLEQLNRRSSVLLRRLRLAARTTSFIFKDLAIVLLVACIALLYLVGAEQISSIGTVTILVIRAVAYAQQSQSALQGVAEESPNLTLLTRRIESLAASHDEFGNVEMDDLETVVVDDVSYRYGDGPPALHAVGFTLHRGESLGVIGPSGGGKSTLVQLLLRLRLPEHGSITVSGVRADRIDPGSWHRLVALVPQDPHLYQGTVADNIRFHRPWVGDDAIRDAARAAHILDEIEQLPDGFDTVLGPRGAGLSGGQRQRIAIARALAGSPQLLVLDEPTSALDPRSEAELQRTIAELRGRITMVIVAHRLTTLSTCDRVLALAGGRVRALGSLDEAMREVGFHPAEEQPA